MPPSMAYLLALLIGCIAGLRTFTAPALVSWAAHLGWLNLSDTWLAFLGAVWTPRILTLLAVGELVADQLPTMPSRTAPPGFVGRVVSGAISGAALGTAGGTMVGGLIAGIAARSSARLAGTHSGRSWPRHFDATPRLRSSRTRAIGGALAIGVALR